ncbi:hypothetical protein PCANC_19077 [Puccinia coronata f. sp. avenae]|uniref:Uncharacterized protein n=1 Tax=Puccinia coronata f. sp. avenae TaxID=200324 RepID=A0A2N5UB62_9BASI|nr:hypothetical protein PCANC_19077 [Puccinia coronata f. sp. avenae]
MCTPIVGVHMACSVLGMACSPCTPFQRGLQRLHAVFIRRADGRAAIKPQIHAVLKALHFKWILLSKKDPATATGTDSRGLQGTGSEQQEARSTAEGNKVGGKGNKVNKVGDKGNKGNKVGGKGNEAGRGGNEVSGVGN